MASFTKCKSGGGKMSTVSGPNTRYKLRTGETLQICTLKGKAYKGPKTKSKARKEADSAKSKAAKSGLFQGGGKKEIEDILKK